MNSKIVEVTNDVGFKKVSGNRGMIVTFREGNRLLEALC